MNTVRVARGHPRVCLREPKRRIDVHHGETAPCHLDAERTNTTVRLDGLSRGRRSAHCDTVGGTVSQDHLFDCGAVAGPEAQGWCTAVSDVEDHAAIMRFVALQELVVACIEAVLFSDILPLEIEAVERGRAHVRAFPGAGRGDTGTIACRARRNTGTAGACTPT